MPHKDPVEAKRYRTSYRAVNLEKIRAREAAYRAAHAGALCARRAAYYAANREALLRQNAAYRASHIDQQHLRASTWRTANREGTRAKHLMRRYGLTVEQYETQLASQDGGCAICGTMEPGGASGRFHVDHRKRDGALRGLLCVRCNPLAASEHLEKHLD